MFYREAGQFKTSYQADQALMPIRQDRIGLAAILLVAFVAIPFFANDFFLTSIMIPFLVFSLAAIGLNVLTGFCGQLSLGTGAFMAAGAYMAYKIATNFTWMPIPVVIVLGALRGVAHAGVGGSGEAIVWARPIASAQIRIGDAVARAPEGSSNMRRTDRTERAERAYLQDGMIVIDVQ